ncbi:WD40 repeat domain-containing protein [Actinosynnema sp. CA-248983]
MAEPSIGEFQSGGVVGPGHARTSFSGDSALVASGRNVWRTDTWELAHQFPEGAVCGLSVDGGLVLVAREGGYAVHDTTTWADTGPVRYGGGLQECSFNHDGTLLAITVHSSTKVVARTDHGWDPVDHPPFDAILDARFSTGSPRLAIARSTGHVELWDTTTWTRLGSAPLTRPESVGISADGTLVAASSRTEMTIWRADTWEVVHAVQWPEFRVPVRLSADLGTLVASTANGTELWDVTSGRLRWTVRRDLMAPTLSPDGRFVGGRSTHWSFPEGPDTQIWTRFPDDAAGLHPLPAPPKASTPTGFRAVLVGAWIALVALTVLLGGWLLGDWLFTTIAGGLVALIGGVVVKRWWHS